MKRVIKRGILAAAEINTARPKEVCWSIAGTAIGAIFGLFVGGVGIAAGGVALGIPAAFILAVVGGAIGNRVGVERDQRSKK